MIAALQHSLEWINQHPHWALTLLFVAALLDSLFVIGAFVPAGVALFAAGALVALGSLELWQAVLTSAAGAIIGDSVSFWLGRRYGERLFTGRLQRRYPDVLLNGRRFFARYGAFSIALARFLGPMRAIVPALAGAAGLKVAAFAAADVVSATAWAFVFVIPGVAFGASLGLAAEVAGRLVLLLLALIATVAITVWLTAASLRTTQRHAEEWIGKLLDWSRSHRRLGKFGAALADPTQPETPVLALLAIVLFALSGAGLWLCTGAGMQAYPLAIDAAVFQTMRDLHSPWGLALAHRLLQLGSWQVYAPVVLVTFACLLVLRKPRAAAHWVAAVSFAGLLSLGLLLIHTLPPPFVYFDTLAPGTPRAGDTVLATALYAFLAVLLSTGRGVRHRRTLYVAVIAVLVLLLVARLYVGVQWFTAAVLSVVIGSAWAGMLGLGYRRHRPERMPTPQIALLIAATFVTATTVAWMSPQPASTTGHVGERTTTRMAWQGGDWRTLPRTRIDIAGRDRQPLNLQWAGSIADIAATLEAAGWAPPPRLTGSSMLRWLTREGSVAGLPVLPQLNAGRHPALTLALVLDEDSAELLRLWPSGLRLATGEPLWVGSMTLVQARNRYRILRYPFAAEQQPDPPRFLDDVKGVRLQAAGPVWLVSLTAAADDTSAAP